MQHGGQHRMTHTYAYMPAPPIKYPYTYTKHTIHPYTRRHVTHTYKYSQTKWTHTTHTQTVTSPPPHHIHIHKKSYIAYIFPYTYTKPTYQTPTKYTHTHVRQIPFEHITQRTSTYTQHTHVHTQHTSFKEREDY